MLKPLKVVAAGLLLVAAACGESTAPQRHDYAIKLSDGDRQFGLANQPLSEFLEVEVTDGGKPAEGVDVEWRIVEGEGATVAQVGDGTDSKGIGRAQVRLGRHPGNYRIEARVPRATGSPVVFQATAIAEPVIESISTNRVAAGDTLTVTGRDFLPDPLLTSVQFDGVPGTTLSATNTRIEVLVPHCVPTRRTELTVLVGGAVRSAPVDIDVRGDDRDPIDLEVGEVLTLADPADLGCVKLPGGQSGLAYLAVPQNAHHENGRQFPFQLVGLTGRPAVLASLDLTAGKSLPLGADAVGQDAAAWETQLRRREQAIAPSDVIRLLEPRLFSLAATPSVGSTRTFEVFNKDDEFTTVTAEVKYVGENVVLYQDVKAPSGGFTAADFANFAALFDDPIFPTVTEAFGEPSDVDDNGRIIVLFTPVVNEMTPKGSNGFVAGFFYGIDLTNHTSSNRAEIFYSIVPDPNGQFGDRRSLSDILRAVPPVLAHELQHMIHFRQKVMELDAAPEVLWLSEALAHAAEELVADALEARGDAQTAFDFRLSNLTRAFLYMEEPTAVSLVNTDGQGTIEERGAQWLFIKYLGEHFGGTELLRRLTHTQRRGVANLEAETGTPWATLFNRWSVALWADDAPELAGVPVDSVYTFPDTNLRQELGIFRGGFPLRPQRRAFTDFQTSATLPVSSPLHLVFEAEGFSPDPFNLSFTRQRGGAFTERDRPQWAIMRIR